MTRGHGLPVSSWPRQAIGMPSASSNHSRGPVGADMTLRKWYRWSRFTEPTAKLAVGEDCSRDAMIDSTSSNSRRSTMVPPMIMRTPVSGSVSTLIS
ncbi:hypothetical protein BZL30_2828 [Mycobacterium kansasii]|uniref:Uncharacterized protein n=1 Tax=Mycobacterium kansasii TaxID=1768 RepID=A0A1V3XLV1_MYCKA|nr:hypothetical protein BZL30_2828 [Mycobacterium kansasii]